MLSFDRKENHISLKSAGFKVITDKYLDRLCIIFVNLIGLESLLVAL